MTKGTLMYPDQMPGLARGSRTSQEQRPSKRDKMLLHSKQYPNAPKTPRPHRRGHEATHHGGEAKACNRMKKLERAESSQNLRPAPLPVTTTYPILAIVPHEYWCACLQAAEPSAAAPLLRREKRGHEERPPTRRATVAPISEISGTVEGKWRWHQVDADEDLGQRS